MPKWWYYGMSCLFLTSTIALAMMQFVKGAPWGYVALGFSLTGVHFLKKFIKLK